MPLVRKDSTGIKKKVGARIQPLKPQSLKLQPRHVIQWVLMMASGSTCRSSK